MSVAFSPDGTRVVTASWDKTARVWDAATGAPSPVPSSIRARWFRRVQPRRHARGHRELRRDGAGVGRGDRQARHQPLEHQGQVVYAAFSPDGTRVVTASWDNTARVWDAATGKPVTGPLEHQGQVYSAAFSPDGTRVVTASRDRDGAGVGRGDRQARHPPARASGPRVQRGVQPRRHPRRHRERGQDRARVGRGDRQARHPPPRASGRGGERRVQSRRHRVVTASDDKTARVWDAATGKPLTSPLEHQAQVESAAFSPDGTRVVTASWDNTARVWDAATGKPVTRPLERGGRC